MMRYVSEDEFEKRIKPYDTDDPIDKAFYTFAHNIMLCTSTADVRENVHATFISEIIKKEDWKGQIQSYYQPNSCSNCHVALTGEENFCPNCGVDMRKNSEDNTKMTVKEENDGRLGKE